MSNMSPEAYLEIIRKYRLLEEGQLSEAEALRGRFAEVRTLAKEMLGRGWLTPYQVNQILKGKGKALLLGSYVLLERLGEGGMGQVFKARNWKLGRTVALKVIRRDRLSNPTAIRRFTREIQAAAQLQHPNIVQTYDADEVDDTHLLVMEYIERAVDLARLVKEQGPLPVARVCDYIRQAALGLQHAHECGLVHRDIKPHNLVIAEVRSQESGVIKILDMGLARVVEEGDKTSQLTQEGAVMGTPDYIAPEQARDSHQVDIRADLYSLGCVMFFLLTGRVPYSGGSLLDKLLRHQTEPIPPVERFRADVPAAVAAVVRKLMAKTPAERFQTPADLAGILQKILQGGSVQVDAGPPPGLRSSMTLPALNPFAGLSSDNTMPATVKKEERPEAPKPRRLDRRFPPKVVAFAGIGGLVIVIAVVAGVMLRRGPSKQSGTQARVLKARFTLENPRPWQDTGIDVEPGVEIAFTARGIWEKKGWPEASPAGLEDVPRTRNVLPEAPAMCLVGRVGNQDPPFSIGKSHSLRATQAGRLFVQANTLDAADVHGQITLDVTGAERVTTLAPRPTRTRVEQADAALAELKKKKVSSPAELPALKKAVAAYRKEFSGTWQAGEAGLLWGQFVAEFSSRLDRLDPANLPDQALAFWHAQSKRPPHEIVGVLGAEPFGHPAPVYAMAYSPDGRLLASGSSDLRLWDAKTLRLLWLNNAQSTSTVSFTSDSKMLATGGTQVRLWDVSGTEPKQKLAIKESGVADISRDGKRLAAGCADLAVRVWDLTANGPELRGVLKGHTALLDCIAFSPDGKLLASGGHDKTVRLWDLTGKEPKARGELKGHGDWIYRLAFSPDGKLLATVGAHDRQVILWDLSAEPKQAAAHHLNAATCSINFAPGGKMLAVGLWDGQLLLWDMTGAAAKHRWHVKAYPTMIWAVPFSPDGKKLATGGDDGVIRQWDLTGKEPVEDPPLPQGHRSGIISLAFSSADAQLLSSGQDKTVRLWDVLRRKQLRQLPTADRVMAAVAWAPDSPLAVGASIADSSLPLWNVDNGKLIKEWLGQRTPQSVTFSEDGTQAISGGAEGIVKLWEVAAGKELGQWEGHTGDVLAVALSPDGRTAASGSTDKTVRLWDLSGPDSAEKKERAILTGFTHAVSSVAFSPDGTLLAAGTGGSQLWIFDLRMGTPRQLLVLPARAQVTAVAFARDGRYLVTADLSGHVIVWSADTGQRIREVPLPTAVLALAVASDGRHLAAGSARGVIYLIRLLPPVPLPDEAAAALKALRAHIAASPSDKEALWHEAGRLRMRYPGTPEADRAIDLQRELPSPFDRLESSQIPTIDRFPWQPKDLVGIIGSHRFLVSGQLNAVAFTPDDRQLISGDHMGGVVLWDATSGREIRKLRVNGVGISALAVSRNGNWVAAATDNAIQIWDLKTEGQPRTPKGQAGARALALSPDGKLLAAGNSRDNVITVWDVATWTKRHTLSGHTQPALSLGFSRDGTLASGSYDGTIRLWDVAAEKMLKTVAENESHVYDVIFLPDGKHLLSFGSEVKLWDLKSGKSESILKGVVRIALAPDGRTLALFSSVFRLWDLPQKRELLQITRHPRGVGCVAFSSDGRRFATGGVDSSIRLWDTAAGKELVPVEEPLSSPLAVTMDGRLLACGGEFGFAPRLCDLTARPWASYHVYPGAMGTLHALAFSPDGHNLISGQWQDEHDWRILDTDRPGQHYIVTGHTKGITDLVCSPDGKLIASSSIDHSVKLWDAFNARALRTLSGQLDVAQCLAFTPDGKTLACGGYDKAVRLWDVASGKPLHAFDGLSGWASGVAFDRRGKQLAALTDDAAVRIWDLDTRAVLRTFPAPKGKYWRLASSPDAKLLAACSDKGVVTVWEFATGKKIKQWNLAALAGSVTQVIFLPDGRHVAVAGHSGVVYIIRLSQRESDFSANSRARGDVASSRSRGWSRTVAIGANSGYNDEVARPLEPMARRGERNMVFRTAEVLLAGIFLAVSATRAADNSGDLLKLTQRSRVARNAGGSSTVTREVTWGPKQTAIVVCDMWDTHHCLNAVKRVEEITPRMNQVLEKARGMGVLIIHAPSSCMAPYKDHPARKRAQNAPRAATVPKDIGVWCHRIPAEEKATYPLDQSDGGCDSEPGPQKAFYAKLKAMGRNPDAPWKAQTDLLTIRDEDAISDSGVEIWNLMEERGIKNVILVGVHTNMCVLGRPFGLRQMAKNGKNVVLMRDMTDTMYNPARRPYVSHFHGTDLIVEHIEKYVCPTITSDQIIGGEPFKFKGDVRPRVVIAIAESEYETNKTLPPFAKSVLQDRLGLDVHVLQGSAPKHVIPGFRQALSCADLVLLSIRRVALPKDDLDALHKYLDEGKPLIAIRTSSHAFDAKGKGPAGHAEWTKFDAEVLGGNYHMHHPDGPLTTIRAADGAEKNPLLNGVSLPFTSKGSLYRTSPLAPSAKAILVGVTPEQPPEPLAWTHTYKESRIFYTSLGHKGDFTNRAFAQLMENAVRWTLHMRLPGADKAAAPFKRAVQEQIKAKRELANLLKSVTDKDSMKAAQQNLPRLTGAFNEVIRWAIILPYPPAGVNDVLKRDFGRELDSALDELRQEMTRIGRLSGGQAFLAELTTVGWLQDPITPWQIAGREVQQTQAGR